MEKEKNKERIPQLRFPEFKNAPAWEQRKLGEVAVSFSGGTPSVGNSKYYNGEIPFIRSAEINSAITELYLTEEGLKNSSAKMVNVGDILYALYGATSGEVGISKINGAINQAILAIKPYDAYNSKFIEQWLKNQKKNIIDKYLQGGQGNLSAAIVKKLLIPFPSLPEQKAIGDFFQTLDRSIDLHQRELENLKNRKKSLLQKMFPKNGESVPKIRFPEFKNAPAWEQRKLGEVAEIVGGGTPSTSNPEYWDGDIDWYAPAEIGEKTFVSESKRKISKLGLEKSSAKLLPVGTVLFTSRAGIGNTAILAKSATTNQGFQSIVPKENLLYSYFIYSMTGYLKHYGEVTGAGSTFVEVSGKQMAKCPISLPSLPEQKAIGDFFSTLDRSIALHQRKLEHLKLRKKALLQKMFP
ncbi:restriction endonuclease subunit S [Streptococcus anginosus]|uniref:restriction endonuclease subunit S n=1 Tax=Streptococcus anginosus TaxID=1328 RepID=UPI0022DEADE9|nr:restriction endonuclease subunit S [Streptococcus anginosus]